MGQLPFGLAKNDKKLQRLKQIGAHHGASKIFLLPLYKT